MTAPETPSLVADCGQCFALCCVLLPFSAVSGFGIDKPGGTPCPHLADDDRCSIHATLRQDGWAGCATFDCFGAGQQVSQVTYGGVSWRESADLGEMAAVLSVMRLLHEMLAHLTEVDRHSPDPTATGLAAEIVVLTGATPSELLAVDLDDLHDRVGDVLEGASASLRSGADLPGPGPGRAGPEEGRPARRRPPRRRPDPDRPARPRPGTSRSPRGRSEGCRRPRRRSRPRALPQPDAGQRCARRRPHRTPCPLTRPAHWG